jgi:2-polyprenyl-3-methyl-5-hydroxy-6-metoxy-1,4-benzoquinol methylase
MVNISSLQLDHVFGVISKRVDIYGLAEVLNTSEDSALSEFDLAMSEAKQTLSLVENLDLQENSSILEIGVGLGVASFALSILGFEVVGLEPGGTGFESNQLASSYMAGGVGRSVRIINESAETVTFPAGTVFDLILSNNVLEHVDNVESALINLLEYLSETGVMVHSCPNYKFPFEPHFGIPLIPLAPRLTRYLLPKRIRQSRLWVSLNFVTASQIRRVLKKTDYLVQFKSRTMAQSFTRLSQDREFQRRHKILGRLAANRFCYKFIIRVLNLPYWIATPMNFIVVHKSMAKDSKVLIWLEGS